MALITTTPSKSPGHALALVGRQLGAGAGAGVHGHPAAHLGGAVGPGGSGVLDAAQHVGVGRQVAEGGVGGAHAVVLLVRSRVHRDIPAPEQPALQRPLPAFHAPLDASPFHGET